MKKSALSRQELQHITKVVNGYRNQLLNQRAVYDGRAKNYSEDLLAIGKPAIPFLLPIVNRSEVKNIVKKMGGADIEQLVELLEEKDENAQKSRGTILMYIRDNIDNYGDALNSALLAVAKNDEAVDNRAAALTTIAKSGDTSVTEALIELTEEIMLLGTPNEREDGLIEFDLKTGSAYSSCVKGLGLCGARPKLLELLERVSRSKRAYTALQLAYNDKSPDLLPVYEKLLKKEVALGVKSGRIECKFLFQAVAMNTAPAQDRLDVLMPVLEHVKEEAPKHADDLEKYVREIGGNESLPKKGMGKKKDGKSKKWQFWKK